MTITNSDFTIMIFLLYDKLCKDKENKLIFKHFFSEKRIKELSSHKKKCFQDAKVKRQNL